MRRLVGYWKSLGLEPEGERWPDPRAFIDPGWDEGERRVVSRYLKSGRGFTAFGGPSWCRLCDSDTGSIEVTDGTFDWPEGLIHYVDEHCVRLPDEFVAHVLAGGSMPPEGLDEGHAGQRDVAWWSAQKGWTQRKESPHLRPAPWVFAPWEWGEHQLGVLFLADGAGMRCARGAFHTLVEQVATVLADQGVEPLVRWLRDGSSPVHTRHALDLRQLTPANQEAFRSAIPTAVAAHRTQGPGEMDEDLWQGYVRLFEDLAGQVAVLGRGERLSHLPNLGRVRDHDGTRSGPGWSEG
jgi:hypothetical protein